MALARERFVGRVTNGLDPVVGPDIASATTIAPTYGVHRVTGTTAVVNITVPSADFQGWITLLPTALWTWTAAGNIVVAGSAVVGKALDLFYNPITAKWYRSYID